MVHRPCILLLWHEHYLSTRKVRGGCRERGTEAKENEEYREGSRGQDKPRQVKAFSEALPLESIVIEKMKGQWRREGLCVHRVFCFFTRLWFVVPLSSVCIGTCFVSVILWRQILAVCLVFEEIERDIDTNQPNKEKQKNTTFQSAYYHYLFLALNLLTCLSLGHPSCILCIHPRRWNEPEGKGSAVRLTVKS